MQVYIVNNRNLHINEKHWISPSFVWLKFQEALSFCLAREVSGIPDLSVFVVKIDSISNDTKQLGFSDIIWLNTIIPLLSQNTLVLKGNYYFVRELKNRCFKWKNIKI